MPIQVYRQPPELTGPDPSLTLDSTLVADWLVRFLADECQRKRGVTKAIVGLSGGVDSAVTACLCARAFGPKNVFCFRMPYTLSSPESMQHAQLVVDALGVNERTVDIAPMVDGYVRTAEQEIDATRLGNVCARCRMAVLFDQSAKLGGLPIGTSNKTERFFGYFTWRADDSPPINPLGDLFKSQVWDLARELEVPAEIIDKPPTADLVEGQTDEGDFGVTYDMIDRILIRTLRGWSSQKLVAAGFDSDDVETVRAKVSGTHWKRHLPTVAMMSDTSVNEYYLRPVDYRGVER
ncbi:MAG: NAD+ synthase [Armatimonadetes bacterium]|nr:NAD+ synthase [Armatimonadota bacterium]